MQLLVVWILLVKFVWAGGMPQVSETNIANAPYHLLYSETRPTGVEYVVSVDHYLAVDQIEKLICNVLPKEMTPGSPPTIAVSIYHQLDKYAPSGGLAYLEENLRGHDLAVYIWNVNLPRAETRLTVMRNADVKALDPPLVHNLDHTKCN